VELRVYTVVLVTRICIDMKEKLRYDGSTSKCEHESPETCCLDDFDRLDQPVHVVFGAPEGTDVYAGAGQCESFKENKS
jgi:hypothetical protein